MAKRGPKPKANGPEYAGRNVSLPKDDWARIDKEAQMEGRKVSQFVRRAMRFAWSKGFKPGTVFNEDSV